MHIVVFECLQLRLIHKDFWWDYVYEELEHSDNDQNYVFEGIETIFS